MTSHRFRPTIAIVALTLALAGLAGCASTPEPEASADPTAGPSTSVEPTAAPTTAPPVSAADVTCEQLLPQEVLDAFAASGWTVQKEDFAIGHVTLDDGLWCKWGDFTGTASDGGQIYGWALISADEADDTQASLVSEGWVREEAAAGVYITENPDTTVATDAEGYGMTFLFGDGWVTVSDTKEGLLIINRPGA